MTERRTYWLDLFSAKTWQEFLDAGANVTGFREKRWATVRQVKPGDYFLCYLTGVSRLIGVLEAISEPYQDRKPIWHDEAFPSRVRVKPVVTLTPETAVPVVDLRDELSIFRDMKSPLAWTGHVRGSPQRWKGSDGEAIVRAIEDAKRSPVVRPIDNAKPSRRPRAVPAEIGPVTVPEGEESPAEAREATAHEEIQWLLLKLGNDMGLDVWVARNDRSRKVNGQRFSDLAKLRKSLPLQFDEATNRTIALIDVLWLRGNAIVAAFEIESTTSIYSGLLRMSDLVAMQPNINIPLYIVAPSERRDKVIEEVNRPTFSRLSPPLNEICQFIAFDVLRERAEQVAPYVRYLNPDVVNEWAESCEADADV